MAAVEQLLGVGVINKNTSGSARLAEWVASIGNLAQVTKLQIDMGIEDVQPIKLHLIISADDAHQSALVGGEVANVLCGLGLVPGKKLVHVLGDEIMTGNNVEVDIDNLLQEAMGGVLLIENIQPPDANGQTQSVMGKIMTALDSPGEGNPILIVTGTTANMTAFLNSNQGLGERFAFHARL